MSAPSGAWGGVLLVLAGIWLLLQTLVAGLPAYILGLGAKTSTSKPAAKTSAKAATSGSSTVVTA